MGYIHCCGGLRRTKTFVLIPADNFLYCELDVLKKCPVCEHFVVQLTRIDKNKEISIVRYSNKKALKFLEKMKKNILYEKNKINYSIRKNNGTFYLNYNEFGVQKRCYSNFSNLKIGLNTLF